MHNDTLSIRIGITLHRLVVAQFIVPRTLSCKSWFRQGGAQKPLQQ